MHRRSEATATGGCGASSMVLDGEYEHGVQEREAKMMVVLVRSEGADRGENGRGTGELGARPWWSHALAPNGAGRGSRRASEGERAARRSFRRAQGRDRGRPRGKKAR